jgi:hypothetical protein
LPCLSGLPAIFQVFFAVFTSFPHVGHFAMVIPLRQRIICMSLKHFLSLACKAAKMGCFYGEAWIKHDFYVSKRGCMIVFAVGEFQK